MPDQSNPDPDTEVRSLLGDPNPDYQRLTRDRAAEERLTRRADELEADLGGQDDGAEGEGFSVELEDTFELDVGRYGPEQMIRVEKRIGDVELSIEIGGYEVADAIAATMSLLEALDLDVEH